MNMPAVLTLEDRIEQTTETLRAAVEDMNVAVSSDSRVSEAVAARLLGYAQGSLKNLRLDGAGPAHYKRPFDGTACSYRLGDLAEWLESAREETE
jgi:hypothetical protein